LVDFLASYQVIAKLVAPIIQNDTLWGLLIVHQCDQPRHWEQWEINLIRQLADQMAIAIQQSSLFMQLQQELTDRQRAQQEISEKNQQLAISLQELAHATRQKDEFLANMSHELRTPLNGILGMTEGLLEGVFGEINAEQRSTLGHIERSGGHLLELINDVLDLSKIEAGHIELELTPTSILGLCHNSLDFIKALALKKRLDVDVRLPFTMPDLYVDERRMRQVLINLLMNAVKFTPEGGRITLAVSRELIAEVDGESQSSPQENIQISVSDTGIGIEPKNLEKLFQPFIQVDSSLNRKYGGTGLGLALVKRIVELHGGRCEVTSEIDVGSCFRVLLPTTSNPTTSKMSIQPGQSVTLSAPERIANADKTGAEISSAQSPLILLAEDNETNRITFSSYLKAKGYQIAIARDGQEAILKAQEYRPDLILMDIQMPNMDGLEAMTQIRALPTLQDIPIIALTSLAMVGDRDRCLAAGANDYLTKPISLKKLVIAIQHLLTPVTSPLS
jgi:signal transduction histidine kinase/ActR/RegA family two-component response regulator